MQFHFYKATQPNQPDTAHRPPARPGSKLMRFDAAMDLGAPASKSFTPVKDSDGTVVDYKDVTIKGYLSTFSETTKYDRVGDYVVKGAFSETIPHFMQNPVLLVDHYNNVDHLAGRFVKVSEDDKGLYVEAMLSNAPGNADIRFKVAEGILRTLSMGGAFHYREDGHGIFKVDLWEGSLTPIPANPDAIFSTRQLTDVELKKVESESNAPPPNASE